MTIEFMEWFNAFKCGIQSKNNAFFEKSSENQYAFNRVFRV